MVDLNHLPSIRGRRGKKKQEAKREIRETGTQMLVPNSNELYSDSSDYDEKNI